MIRPAQPEDAEPVIALIHAAYRGYVPRLGRDPQPMTDDYAALIAAGEVFVLETEATLAGVLVVQEPESNTMLVRTVGVAPGRQQRGLGTQLMAYAERLADERDLSRVRLYTNEVMEGTARLYARLGYVETSRDGPAGKQVIYMAKEVPSGRTPWFDHIVTDSGVCFGKVRIAGTRHYIDHLLGMIEGGFSFDDILSDYPDLKREELEAMMGFVREVVASKRNGLEGEHRNG